jgi:4'-phosphopantetheinyl transferase
MAPHASPVEIWTISLDEPREIVIAPDEQERAARLRQTADRLRWARARAALRAIVSSRLGCGPLDFIFHRGPHGKPFVEGGPEFNLSHSGEWAIIAVSSSAAVGVDIERMREDVDIAKLLGRLGEEDLPHSRPALYQRWARREAASKTTGGPLFEPVDPRVCLADLTAPPGCAAAVGLLGFEPQPVYCGSR